jgi:hypothetical protein
MSDLSYDAAPSEDTATTALRMLAARLLEMQHPLAEQAPIRLVVSQVAPEFPAEVPLPEGSRVLGTLVGQRRVIVVLDVNLPQPFLVLAILLVIRFAVSHHLVVVLLLLVIGRVIFIGEQVWTDRACIFVHLARQRKRQGQQRHLIGDDGHATPLIHGDRPKGDLGWVLDRGGEDL